MICYRQILAHQKLHKHPDCIDSYGQVNEQPALQKEIENHAIESALVSS